MAKAWPQAAITVVESPAPDRLRAVSQRGDCVDEFLRRCALNFRPHADALAELAA